jgi:hypothetical protein
LSNQKTTMLDRARDELMSHVVRCDVLASPSMDDRLTWLAETMEFMTERYPMLSDLQIAHLETMGRRFIQPAIPHGRGNTAHTVKRNLDELLAAEVGDEPSGPEGAVDTADVGDSPEASGQELQPA